MKISGNIKKMLSKHSVPILYNIPIGDESVPISDFLSKTIKISFLNEIYCIECNRQINKTFAQGYCYPCFSNSPKTISSILSSSN